MKKRSVEHLDSVKSDGSVAITALGMACSLGLSHVHACAAARAGITRIRELKTVNVAMTSGFGREVAGAPPELKGHSVPDVGLGYVGIAKVLALATAGMRDLLSSRAIPADQQLSTHFMFNLSDCSIVDAAALEAAEDESEAAEVPSQEWQLRTAEIPLQLMRRLGLAIPKEQLHLTTGGHVGVFELIIAALRLFEKNFHGRVIVGGIESCVEPSFLFAADQLNLLRTNQNPVGFIPGEAAAFFLLERIESSRRTGRALPSVQSVSITADPSDTFSEEMPLGEGLAQAIDQAIADAGEPPELILGDLNGTERRAADWGHALLRSSQRASIHSLPLWLPALSFGEIGAATVASSVHLAVRAWERGYAPGKRAAIWAASDDRRRGAMVLQFTT